VLLGEKEKFWWRGLNRQVADVESRRVGKRIDGGFRGLLCVVISIASALVLVIGECLLNGFAEGKTQWMLAMLNVLC
jgi:hypothetical protein